MNLEETDWKHFFDDAEEICFNCGSTGTIMIVVSRGVALCAACLEIIKEDYPKEEIRRNLIDLMK